MSVVYFSPEATRLQRRRIFDANWWRRYNNYLTTPGWRLRRQLVLRRANGFCEGCGQRRAVEVHHMRYPRDCWPGSADWLAREKLFDLHAVCEQCHVDVHSRGVVNA